MMTPGLNKLDGLRRRRSGWQFWQVVVLLTVFLLNPLPSHGYSVLTHEAIVDAAWDSGIQPLILARYPATTTEELRVARSYAYGGCIIQDMGYYPFGSPFFTDLLHYVRSGDFIEAMLRDARDPNEYAFALGAMSHLVADTTGHSVAINPSLPLRYPKLQRKYGNVVSYAEAPKQHILVEFSFDVVQVASGAYAPQAYHDFIGFHVAKPLLERAFRETYGLDMKDLFVSEDLALGSYRRGVSTMIPKMTRVAWSQRHSKIEKLTPDVPRQAFLYNLSRQDYEKEFGTAYRQPGVSSRFLALFFRIVPKVGPFGSLSFKAPTPAMEMLFQESVSATKERYATLLTETNSGTDPVMNLDFDTGNPTLRGEYSLADTTYATLLDKLADRKFNDVPPRLAADILSFYSAPGNDQPATKKERARWEKTQSQLDALKQFTAQNR